MPVPVWAWLAVLAVLAGALALDLFVFHRRPHEVTMREAALTSGLWVALGLGFAGVVAVVWGGHAAGGYLAGYLIEESLSVDNIFVFSLLLTAFAVPAANQHRVLFWGVIGALVFRGIFIAAGAALLETFHWALYGFGAFLVVTGIKLARSKHEAVEPERNLALRLVRRLVPMTAGYRGSRFFVREAGRRLATPMVAVLAAVET
ncbi:MAG TPA: TerC/Alx family metal homeostasis membrane protein, partial [Acidimicrobiia bacterium]|nr:TerC/Alx family metal homeostasis membrane protein [Acidimicrobiia bacterium]